MIGRSPGVASRDAANSDEAVIPRKTAIQDALDHPNVSDYIIDNSPLLIVRVKPDGRTLYANQAACKASGYSKQEILDYGWVELNYPGERKEQIEQLQKEIAINRDVRDYELVITNRAGEDRIIRWHTANMFDENGDVLEMIGLGKDITEERERELAARNSASRLAEAQRVAKIGSWEIDLKTGALWWSAETHRMFGLPEQPKTQLNFGDFFSRVFAQDKDKVKAAFDKSLAEKLPFDMRYRVAVPNQPLRHVHALGENHYDDEGNISRSLGTVRDITAEVIRENKIRAVEAEAKELQEYNDYVVQKSPMFIVALHYNGNVKYINDAGCKISGYSRDELIGARFDEAVFPGEYRQQIEHLYGEANQFGRLVDFEATICRKDREERTLSWASVNRFDENGRIKEVIGIGTDITALKESQRELEHLAHYDPLTKLPNRFYLSVRLELAIADAIRSGNAGALIYVDIDRFKNINESAGHSKGDELLQLVAVRLRDCMRQDDLVARLNGDEFAVLIQGIGDVKNANRIVSKIREAFEEKFVSRNSEYRLSTSLGVSLFPRDGETVEDIFKNADIAVRNAKDKGGDIETFYTQELNSTTNRKIWLEKHLRNALEREEFVIHYQPQVRLVDGALTGAEALLRWVHPEEGTISPGEFIPIAESSGLIIPIGDWVLENACITAKRWLDTGLNLGHLAVNIAGPQITRGNLIKSCQNALSKSALSPSLLELEVTEGFIMKDAENSIEILESLRDLGIAMSIDDFGTGYSSLSYLKRLPIDQLKIDRSFIKDIPENKDDIAITKTIVSLGQNLGLSVIAEGVETEEQRSFLLSLGCELAQGFLFHKPLSAEEFFDCFIESSMIEKNPNGLSSNSAA